jgi:hypothetical protein
MIQYYFPNNTILLMTIENFDPNIVLVNIIKLKLYRFTKNHTLQLVLTRLSDFLSKEPMEATHSNNMFTKQLIQVT